MTWGASQCYSMQEVRKLTLVTCSMPLEENLNTFKYFIEEADKINLAYICLLRYIQFFDSKIDGGRFNNLFFSVDA